jgi:hypothetical protein
MLLLWEAKIGVYVLFNLSCPAVSASRSSFVLLKYPEEISFRSSLLEAPKEAHSDGVANCISSSKAPLLRLH